MVLLNFIGSSVWIFDYPDYERAVSKLQQLYVNPLNEIHARYILLMCRQKPEEVLDEYPLNLRHLSGDCNYKAVSAEEHRAEAIRGLLPIKVRQQLLENVTLDLTTAFDQARALEQAQKTSKSYSISQRVFSAAAISEGNSHNPNKNITSTVASKTQRCFFHGNNRHPHRDCPAINGMCWRYGKISHYVKVCHSRTSVTLHSPNSVLMAASFIDLVATTTPMKLNGKKIRALVNTVSTESFISELLV